MTFLPRGNGSTAARLTDGNRSSTEDWKNYVEPDLRDMFRSAQEVVQAALKTFRPDKPATVTRCTSR
jgi:hypothetical protein